jgi:hypothetical protein
MDPGASVVVDWLIDVIEDIVSRYGTTLLY